jgi:hypothetical protein
MGGMERILILKKKEQKRLRVLKEVKKGNMEEEEERSDGFPSDADGSAKIALIAIDRPSALGG